jgi:uncharacterized YccA/Bax inhibitor family protein
MSYRVRMASMESRNPVLKRYEKPQHAGFAYPEGQVAYGQAAGEATTAADFETLTAGAGLRMTLNDVIMKTGAICAITVLFAVVGWNLVETMPWIFMGALFAALAVGLANSFMKTIRPALVMVFAVLEGIVVGAASNLYNEIALASGYEGLVMQAVIGTMTAFGVMLFVYQTGLIKVNGRFKKVMMVALISYLVIALASFVGAMFGVGGGWGFYGVGPLGLILCAVGVLIASFTLLLDFEAIKQGIAMGVPERESWRMAFGLLVTLVWLYLEILRFLAIAAASNR